jgi:molybdopterin-biosynthesis enzyme MoeA-like protein
MPAEAERAIVVHGAGESQLLPLMTQIVGAFPQLKLFSLPAFVADGTRRLELGVRGDPAALDAAMTRIVAGVEAGGFRWEPFVPETPPRYSE